MGIPWFAVNKSGATETRPIPSAEKKIMRLFLDVMLK